MCTVSLIRGAEGQQDATRWRLVCNRDELHTRAMADPPSATHVGPLRVVAPRDPDGGGTWVATSSAGLGFVLLNRRVDQTEERHPRVTRGAIIPAIWDCASVDAVRARLRRCTFRTRPFTLVAVDDRVAVEFVDTPRGVREIATHGGARLVWTSSSWDANAVRRHRLRLFARLVPAPDAEAQDRFHAWVDADEPARGILMRRADACTVSVTTVDMSAARGCLRYRPMTAPGDVRVFDVPRGA